MNMVGFTVGVEGTGVCRTAENTPSRARAKVYEDAIIHMAHMAWDPFEEPSKAGKSVGQMD